VSQSKRQHIIPRCYLSAWLEPVAPPGQTRAIWRISKDGQTKRRKSPEKSFVETDRYTVKLKAGGRDLHVEHTLGQIESNFAGVLGRMTRREHLSPLDKAKICTFTAAMIGRTCRRADAWKGLWINVKRQVENLEAKRGAHKTGSREPPFSRSRAGGWVVTSEELDDMLLNSHPDFLVTTIEVAAPILFSMQLSLFTTEDPVGFVTSDDPCVVHSPKSYRYPPMMRSPGLAQPDVEITLPLSPRLLIAFTHGAALPRYTKLDTKMVDAINRLTVGHAREEFVSLGGICREAWFIQETLPPDAWEFTRDATI
jgi:hypothetical protein